MQQSHCIFFFKIFENALLHIITEMLIWLSISLMMSQFPFWFDRFVLFSQQLCNKTYSYATFTCQLLFGLLGWIGIAQVTIEILVEYFWCLFAKVTTFATRIEESWTQYHDRLTGWLFQLHLNGTEFFVNNLYHTLNLFGSDGPAKKKAKMG